MLTRLAHGFFIASVAITAATAQSPVRVTKSELYCTTESMLLREHEIEQSGDILATLQWLNEHMHLPTSPCGTTEPGSQVFIEAPGTIAGIIRIRKVGDTHSYFTVESAIH